MKVVALIPFWTNYKSLKDSLICKPLVKISGKSLINRAIEIISYIESIDSTVIFTSDSEVSNDIDSSMDYEVIQRSVDLNSDKTTIEDVINGFLQTSDAEVILLIHPRSPFIKPETIADCIEEVLAGKSDSAFVAKSIQRHVWYRGDPVNFLNHGDTPPLSELEPVLVESSSIYVFTRELFEKTRHRIGENPYIKEVGHFEGFEIDNRDDMIMAELIINAGLDKEVL